MSRHHPQSSLGGIILSGFIDCMEIEAVATDTTGNSELARHRANLKKKIQAAFEVFDPDHKGRCLKEDIRTVIHSLDMNPRETQVSLFVASISEDEDKEVQFDRFEQAILPVMENNEWPRASEEILLEAFRMIDTEHKGYLEVKELEDFLKTNGEFFRASELEDMFKAAVDSKGTIDYVKYAHAATQ
ncbi:hypothetical protein PAPYR_11754 [Paratrimastix pyriformis]|uniref:EF-hand domain-containing protein n=1 Tax=Paratrimastix pyriformis TaxID=342808 RepID=A0ABQ8U368_9EUKA|nr:hypothetical protein PAPYR_11754 [Paratrimastix pyriformis]